MQRQQRYQGFSLVELSIVLVILGLLTGGILGGQSLIRAAELNAIIREQGQYQVALNTFKSKYGALPGDFRDAGKFWGERATSNCHLQAANGIRTCGGDGNGQLNARESLFMWQHLSNAGLVNGNFVPAPYAGTYNNFPQIAAANATAPEDFFPGSKLGGGFWLIRNPQEGTASNYQSKYFNGDRNRNFMMITGLRTLSSGQGYLPSALLPPEDAWGIDKKLDDGRPATGVVRSPTGHFYSADASSGSTLFCVERENGSYAAYTHTDVQYRLSSSREECVLLFTM